MALHPDDEQQPQTNVRDFFTKTAITGAAAAPAGGTGDAPPAPPSPPGGGRPPIYEPPAPHDPGGKVMIDTGIKHLPSLHAKACAAIVQGNNPPIMFRQGERIVRLIRDSSGAPKLQVVTKDVMRHELSDWAHFHRNATRLDLPPMDLVNDLLAARELPLPVLRAVTTAPVFASEGSLSLTPGYNEKSQLYYAPMPGFTALDVPATVTIDDVQAANKLICNELLVDFPMASKADRDNAVAMMLLQYVREFITGPTPMHLIESSMNGSGKGKLASVMLTPFLGKAISVIPDPKNEEELIKELTTALLAAKPVIVLDNFDRVFSAGIAAALTASIWDKRVLGGQTSADVEVRSQFVMTGKNVQMATEIGRRCVRIRLTPTTDRPEERHDFKHEEIEGYALANRAEIIRAAHVIVRWWLQQGRPKAEHKRKLGSYESWSAVMGGLLECAGYQDFLANHREFVSSADVERNGRSEFFATWYDWSQLEPGREWVSASDLMPLADPMEGLPLKGGSDKARLTSLGVYLSQNTDSYVEHEEIIDENNIQRRLFRLVRGTQKRGKQMWAIKLVQE